MYKFYIHVKSWWLITVSEAEGNLLIKMTTKIIMQLFDDSDPFRKVKYLGKSY